MEWPGLTEPLSSALMLKPHLIEWKNGSINVIDAHVVYAVQPLDASHRTKVSKYNTPELQQQAGRELRLQEYFGGIERLELELE